MSNEKFILLAKETIELKNTLLSETPIDDFTRIGDFQKRYSIKNPVDRKLLTSPKAEIKIRRIWEKTPIKFNLVFVNDPRVNSSEFVEIGEVNEDFVRQKMKISKEELPIDPNACTVIYTNNSGDERVMASGWILAHRLGHAIQRNSKNSAWNGFVQQLETLFKSLLYDVYNIRVSPGLPVGQDRIVLKLAAQQLGTMKSARDSNLRSWFEFAYELFAQYLLYGKIKLNPLPEQLVSKLEAFGRKRMSNVYDKDMQEVYNRHDLEYYVGLLESELDSTIESLAGKIFVM